MHESFLSHLDEGDPVAKGMPIGTTYQTNDNFPHLHFEIRAGTLFSGHACNPWKYLPCQHCSPFRANVSASVGQIESSNNCSATVVVSLPPNQLTFDAVRLEVSREGILDFNRTINLCELNIFYTNYPSYDTLRLDNNTVIPDLIINPRFFNSQSFSINEWLTVDYTFLNIPVVSEGNMAKLQATVFDVNGEKVITDPVYYDSSCLQVDPPTTTGNTNTMPTYDVTTSLNSSFRPLRPSVQLVLAVMMAVLLPLSITKLN